MSFSSYPAYRETRSQLFDQIPAHWNHIILKRIVLLVKDGTHGTYSRTTEGVPLLSAKNVFSGGVRISAGESLISQSDHAEIVSNGFPSKGDVLVTCVGTIGRVAVYDFDYPISFQRSVAFIRLTERAVPEFYKLYIESKPYQDQLRSIVKSSAQGGVYMGDLVTTEAVLPPVNEQLQIARFLDHETAKIDTLIHEQKRLIELLKEKRQAVISHAVTKGLDPDVPMKDSGVEWLGEVPAHWIVARLKKHLEPVIDYRGKTPTKTECGVFLVTARNIKNGVIDYSLSQEFISENDYHEVMRRGRPMLGDVLFTTEAPLGEVAQVDDETIALAQRIIKFRGLPDILDNSYLKLFLQSTAFQQGLMTFATGSTALGIKSARLGYLSQLVPPIDEQRQIVIVVDEQVKNYEQLIISANEAINLLRERRSALISAAVTGKIDVRDWQPPTNESTFGEELRQASLEAQA